MAETTPKNLLERFKTFKQFSKANLKKGDKWYVLSKSNWTRNFSYVDDPSISPAPSSNMIDNKDIIDQRYPELIDPEIGENLTRLKIIHEDDYKVLANFCLIQNQFPREVITRPKFSNQNSLKSVFKNEGEPDQRLKLDIYPVLVDLVVTNEPSEGKIPVFAESLLVPKRDYIGRMSEKIRNRLAEKYNFGEISHFKLFSIKLEDGHIFKDLVGPLKEPTAESIVENHQIKSIVPLSDYGKYVGQFSEENHMIVFVVKESVLSRMIELIKDRKLDDKVSKTHDEENPTNFEPTEKAIGEENEEMGDFESRHETSKQMNFSSDLEDGEESPLKTEPVCFSQYDKVQFLNDGEWGVGIIEEVHGDGEERVYTVVEESEEGSIVDPTSSRKYYNLPSQKIAEYKLKSPLGKVSEFPCRPPPPPKRGLVGLANLGHTCFMSSTIQCLSNAEVLVDYFLSGRFKEELNPTNPLGWKGKIATSYGRLTNAIWRGDCAVISPSELKRRIGQFAPRFSGYSQQDSSELLFFLLDGLHEDLNLVKEKPSTQPTEANGRPDAVVAEDAWKTHLLRNRSIVVDHFQGQLKSTVMCPTCDFVSVSFDPFLALSLPLISKEKRVVTVTIVLSNEHKQCARVSIKLPILSCVYHLLAEVAMMADFTPEYLVLVEVLKNHGYKVFQREDEINSICDNDELFVFHVKDLALEEAEPADPDEDSAKTDSTDLSGEKDSASGDLSDDPPAKTAQNGPAEPQAAETAQKPENMADDETFAQKAADPEGDARLENMMLKKEEFLHKETSQKQIAPKIENGKNSSESSEEKIDAKSDAENNGEAKGFWKYGERRDRKRFKLKREVVIFVNHSYADEDGELKNFGVPGVLRAPFGVHITQKSLFEALQNILEPCHPQNDPKEILLEQKGSGARLYGFDDGDQVAKIRKTFVLQTGNEGIKLVWHSKDDLDFSKFTNPLEHASVAKYKNFASRKKKTHTLGDCFDEYCKEETLSAQNTWYCWRCKEHKNAVKKLELWRLPDICIIHLKRFQQNVFNGQKIDVHVDFPLEGLDLTPRLAPAARQANGGRTVYDLFAVSNHFGFMGSGHYTAYCQNALDKKWYCFDDTKVTELLDPPLEIVRSSAYMLFYKRRGFAEDLLRKRFDN